MYRKLLKNKWTGFLLSGLLVACSRNGEQHHEINQGSKDVTHNSVAESIDTALLLKIASAASDDGKIRAQLFAHDSLRVGYQNLYVKLTDDVGNLLDKA